MADIDRYRLRNGRFSTRTVTAVTAYAPALAAALGARDVGAGAGVILTFLVK
jgi:hypothetical protein